MLSMGREELIREVMGRLADPQFSRLLRASTPDGRHPIIVARTEDQFADVLDDVEESGGAGNLVVPLPSGYIVVAISVAGAPGPDALDGDALDKDVLIDACTVGVFVARLVEDGAGEARTYRIHCGHREGRARADLVGAA